MDAIESLRNFSPATWEENGLLTKIEPETDEKGKLVPKYKVYNPGHNERKSGGYQYLICYGFVEDDLSDSPKNTRGKIRTIAALPLGVGKTLSTPEDILSEVCSLRITVRRTAGSTEKIVYGITGPISHLAPWRKMIQNGSIFNANKVTRHVESIPLTLGQRLRVFFLSITKLTDSGVYMIPKSILDFRANNAVSFNLLVTLKIDADISQAGIKGIISEKGEKVVTFMLHVGNFKRKLGKIYSVEYCQRKVDKMMMIFSLGSVGGLSFHIKITGKLSKRLFAQIGFQRNICYSLMDINPWLNKLTWNNTCEIRKVSAVLQPSVPRDFNLYEDVFIDNTGKILSQ